MIHDKVDKPGDDDDDSDVSELSSVHSDIIGSNLFSSSIYSYLTQRIASISFMEHRRLALF